MSQCADRGVEWHEGVAVAITFCQSHNVDDETRKRMIEFVKSAVHEPTGNHWADLERAYAAVKGWEQECPKQLH